LGQLSSEVRVVDGIEPLLNLGRAELISGQFLQIDEERSILKLRVLVVSFHQALETDSAEGGVQINSDGFPASVVFEEGVRLERGPPEG
jgi:hypothetical protein